jgi:hypothetical protein
MFKQDKENKNTYKFKAGNKTIEVYFSEDGSSELYDIDSPADTGFIFSEKKQLINFVNNLTDVVENQLGE